MNREKQNIEVKPVSFLPTRLYSGTYQAIKRALIEQLLEEAEIAPGEEKIVLVPSNYAGEELYSLLARKSEVPLMNIRFLTLIDVAKHLLAKQGFALRIADGTIKALSLAHILKEHVETHGKDCPLRKAAGEKGTVGSLLEFFDSLEESCIGPIEAEQLTSDRELLGSMPHPEKTRDLLLLFRDYTSFLEKNGFSTRTSVVREAVKRFESPGYDFRVKVYGFYDFTPIQWFFTEKLILSGLCDDVFIPVAAAGLGPGNAQVDDPKEITSKVPLCLSYGQELLYRLTRLCDGNITILPEREKTSEFLKRLSGGMKEERKELPFLLIEAPHEQGELRAIARILASKKDQKGSRAIIFRNVSESAVQEAESVFAEFDLDVEILWNRPLLAFPLVRTLLGILKIPLDDYPRSKVIDVLTSPFFDLEKFLGEAPSFPGLWENASKRAGIIKGDDWEIYLERLLESLGKYPISTSDEEEFDKAEEILKLKESTKSLVKAIKRLRELLSPVPNISSFAELAEFTRTLLLNHFELKGDTSSITEQERVTRRIQEILRRLESCERMGVPFPGPEKGVELLETILKDERAPLYAPGTVRRGEGVILGDAVSLRGLTFDEIHLASVNESIWPSSSRGNSLFRDAEKETLRKHLEKRGIFRPFSTRQEEVESERFLFSIPFMTGGTVSSISYLRSDLAGKKKAPSPFLLELISTYKGPRVFASGLSKETVGKEFVSIPRQVKESLRSPGVLSKKERVISHILGIPLEGETPAIGRRAHTIYQKASEALSRWTAGEELFPAPSVARSVRLPKTEVNHTLLDNYIKCPYRTYLRYVVGLAPLSEPEEVLAISRRELGIIAHRALHLIFREKARGNVPPSPAEAVTRALLETSREIPIGLPGLREIASKEITEKISQLVSEEAELSDGWQPAHFEIAFGGKTGRRVELETTLGTVSLSGKIDRIDLRDDEIRVVDYKYSKGTTYSRIEEKISKGILNQVPIYALAAASIIGDSSSTARVHGGYIFLEADNPDHKYRFTEITPGSASFAAWKRSLELLLSSLGKGLYPPLPDSSFTMDGSRESYCSNCDFRELCRVNPEFKGTGEIVESLKKQFEKIKGELPWHEANRKTA